jgi:hypothetical protein
MREARFGALAVAKGGGPVFARTDARGANCQRNVQGYNFGCTVSCGPVAQACSQPAPTRKYYIMHDCLHQKRMCVKLLDRI